MQVNKQTTIVVNATADGIGTADCVLLGVSMQSYNSREYTRTFGRTPSVPSIREKRKSYTNCHYGTECSVSSNWNFRDNTRPNVLDNIRPNLLKYVGPNVQAYSREVWDSLNRTLRAPLLP